jgi:Fic family protein
MSTGRKIRKQQEEERKSFKPYEGRKKKDMHIRLTKDMLMDEKYQSLSANAKVLYSYMKLWSYGSNEYKTNGTFDYSVELAQKACGLSNKTAVRCFQELVDKGFIARENNAYAQRKVAKWSFSDNWWTGRGI